MPTKNTILLILAFQVSIAFGQRLDLLVFNIAPNLLAYANAVVRSSKTQVQILKFNKILVHFETTITVLNKLGNQCVTSSLVYEPGDVIKKLKATIYDANGNVVKEYFQNDFRDISLNGAYADVDDSRIKIIDFRPFSYPYTICFTYTLKTKSTAFIPKWTPVTKYYLSVEKSVFQLEVMEGINYGVQELRFADLGITKEQYNRSIIYTAKNLMAIESKAFTSSLKERTPMAQMFLAEFNLRGVHGNANDWKSFGNWMNSDLIDNNLNLSKKTKEEIQTLTYGINDKRKRAEIIYKYMQNRTRYISIQEGIGGWRTSKSNEVDRLGYGDCKDLANYTRALLNEGGVESYYCVVKAGMRKENMDTNYLGIQGNHVILMLPNDSGNLWLECTDQKIPFGYLGKHTDDRLVMVVKPTGVEFIKTPLYKENVLTKSTVYVSPDATVHAEVVISSKGAGYNVHSHTGHMNSDEVETYYIEEYWNELNGMSIDSHSVKNDTKNFICTETIGITLKKYATLSPNRIHFNFNPFNRLDFHVDKKMDRVDHIVIEREVRNRMETRIDFPKGFDLEYIPNSKKIESKFGTYEIIFTILSNSQLSVKRDFELKAGTFSSVDYELFKTFIEQAVVYDRGRVIFVNLEK